MGRPHKIDEIDLHILDVLQREGRIPNMALAERVGLSSAPCFRRVKALERARVIRRYVALLDPAALELSVTVLVRVGLESHAAERVQVFERAMKQRPEVMECWLMAGASDFLIRVVVKDVEAYERFQREILSRVPGVASINATVALKQVKFETGVPLDGRDRRATDSGAGYAQEEAGMLRPRDTSAPATLPRVPISRAG